MEQFSGLLELKKLIRLMEDARTPYLTDCARTLERYLTQAMNEEINRTEFNLLISGLIEVVKIDLPNDYAGREKKRQIIELAKMTIPRFNSPVR
jgi:hypothetical protein